MLDRQNREIDYLRISITDRCNLRCVYCMPANGVQSVAHRDILTFDEIVRIVRISETLGICKIKLTGGEPLVRKGAAELVREIRTVSEIEQVTMTSNGVLLGDQAAGLKAAGLDAVNVSLDSLDPVRFAEITRGGKLEQVLAGIDAAVKSGLRVKLNCVPTRAAGGLEAVALAEFARERPIDVRFIELMPIGEGDAAAGIPTAEIKRAIGSRYGELSPSGAHGNGPAAYETLAGFVGKIGFIGALSGCFCAECNRIRLTATGFLKLCLQYDSGVDLRGLLRGGASDGALADAIRGAILAKPHGQRFDAGDTAHSERKNMSQIGG